jgi:hypothetical protein
MKNRNTVLILGVTSILILISVQVFIITGVWKQKNELFAIKFFVLSQEAIYNIRREMSTDGFDTVRLLLDQYSEGTCGQEKGYSGLFQQSSKPGTGSFRITFKIF